MTRWLVVSILLTLAASAGSIYVFTFQYEALPERMPIHWNIHGEPDGWVDKSDGLGVYLLLPARWH